MKRTSRTKRSLAFLVAAAALTVVNGAASADQPVPEHKVTQSESYIMLEPMYATVMDAGKPSGLLMVAIGLDIPDAWLRGQADHAMPLLRDDYVRSLMNYAAASVRPWRQPDVTEIAARLQRVTDRALHKTGAKVLLAQVAIRITR
jgi:flagellar basal body-associated protein FliL